MKKITFLAIFFAALILGIQGVGNAQVLLDENFDYPANDNITAHGWAAHSGAGVQPITVTAPGLSFPGYLDSGLGNAALLDNTGEDDNRTFTTQTSGAVYTSFMVKVTTTAAGYFYHLGLNPMTTTFRARVFMNATNHFGISVGTGAVSYATATYTPGNTYLLVVKYEIIPGTTNDAVSLYVFDAAIPYIEPVAAVGPIVDATQADFNPGSIGLRQFVNTQNVTVDGIRVGKTWADVAGVQPVPTLSEWGLILLGVALAGIGAFYIMRRRNSELSV
jgi:hypothetical protein